MERITFESDGYFAVRGKDCFDDQDENYCGPAIDRLAAYEDTGLTPKDVVDLMGNHGMALSELAKVPQWIPVTERLPEAERIAYQEKYNTDEPVEVLVMIEGATEPTALFYGGRGSFFDFVGDETIFYPVTSWRPMPAAPKEE